MFQSPCAVAYLIWAFVPASVLASLGITYYPSPYWATALPAWFCVSVLTLLIGYEWCVLVGCDWDRGTIEKRWVVPPCRTTSYPSMPY